MHEDDAIRVDELTVIASHNQICYCIIQVATATISIHCTRENFRFRLTVLMIVLIYLVYTSHFSNVQVVSLCTYLCAVHVCMYVCVCVCVHLCRLVLILSYFKFLVSHLMTQFAEIH